MKTSKIPAFLCATEPKIWNQGLLCEALPTPVEISFATQRPALVSLWRPARLLWTLNQRAEAIAVLNDTTRRLRRNPGVCIPTMFLAAHLQMEDGETIGGERSLQGALKLLSEQTGLRTRRRGWMHPGLLVPETFRSYRLSNRDWLILAIHALLKDDRESCLAWIHRAERRSATSAAAAESLRQLRLIGDLHAVLACIAVHSNELAAAEILLATAYKRHTQANAFQSIGRDLVLTSRLAVLQGQTLRSKSLLNAAECQLAISAMALDAGINTSGNIIRSQKRAKPGVF